VQRGRDSRMPIYAVKSGADDPDSSIRPSRPRRRTSFINASAGGPNRTHRVSPPARGGRGRERRGEGGGEGGERRGGSQLQKLRASRVQLTLARVGVWDLAEVREVEVSLAVVEFLPDHVPAPANIFREGASERASRRSSFTWSKLLSWKKRTSKKAAEGNHDFQPRQGLDVLFEALILRGTRRVRVPPP
jgi:hypothetical protein